MSLPWYDTERAYLRIAFWANPPGTDIVPIAERMEHDWRALRAELQRAISHTTPGSDARQEVDSAVSTLGAAGRLIDAITQDLVVLFHEVGYASSP